MFLETERKIITTPDAFNRSDFFTVKRVYIEQTYISTKKWCEIRLRSEIDDDGDDKKDLTIKIPFNRFRRVEINIPLPSRIFGRFFRKFKKKGSIQKIRTYFEDENYNEISLDFYMHPINVYLAEIESPHPYKLPEIPLFLSESGIEVTENENFASRMIFRNFFGS